MEIKNVKRKKKKPKKVMISLLISPEVSKWMRKENVSPTAVFDEAIKELMAKNNYNYKEVE